MGPILSVRNVHKSFGQLKAVQAVSLDVPQGVVTAVVGPNGAGKTTLFNCISGVAQPDQAEIRLLRPGVPEPVALETLKVEEICRLGIARTFQQVRLFDSLSVIDNVMLGGLHLQKMGWTAAMVDRLLKGYKKHKLLREEAGLYLTQVGLEKQAFQLAGNLDHGNRRRVEIARALAAKPLVLLLDEPAAGMNRIETDELQALLRGLCKDGMAVLLIEHDMKLVMQLSSRVYVMDHGELLTFGKPEEVTANPKVVEA
ncbi:MAG: ABC-type branched-chain amino acid transport system, ATPase component, partial [Polaromonas sp.]|nr:ABC-type branched-chain amino acid transport system, ATPase component [Polaromonas sp.]